MDLGKFVSFARSGKAMTAGGAAIIANHLSQIAIRYLDYRMPGFADAVTTQAIDDLILGAVVYAGAYVPNQTSN